MSELVDEGQTLHFRFDFFQHFSAGEEKLLIALKSYKKEKEEEEGGTGQSEHCLENRNNLMRSI